MRNRKYMREVQVLYGCCNATAIRKSFNILFMPTLLSPFNVHFPNKIY